MGQQRQARLHGPWCWIDGWKSGWFDPWLNGPAVQLLGLLGHPPRQILVVVVKGKCSEWEGIRFAMITVECEDRYVQCSGWEG